MAYAMRDIGPIGGGKVTTEGLTPENVAYGKKVTVKQGNKTVADVTGNKISPEITIVTARDGNNAKKVYCLANEKINNLGIDLLGANVIVNENYASAAGDSLNVFFKRPGTVLLKSVGYSLASRVESTIAGFDSAAMISKGQILAVKPNDKVSYFFGYWSITFLD